MLHWPAISVADRDGAHVVGSEPVRARGAACVAVVVALTGVVASAGVIARTVAVAPTVFIAFTGGVAPTVAEAHKNTILVAPTGIIAITGGVALACRVATACLVAPACAVALTAAGAGAGELPSSGPHGFERCRRGRRRHGQRPGLSASNQKQGGNDVPAGRAKPQPAVRNQWRGRRWSCKVATGYLSASGKRQEADDGVPVVSAKPVCCTTGLGGPSQPHRDSQPHAEKHSNGRDGDPV